MYERLRAAMTTKEADALEAALKNRVRQEHGAGTLNLIEKRFRLEAARAQRVLQPSPARLQREAGESRQRRDREEDARQWAEAHS